MNTILDELERRAEVREEEEKEEEEERRGGRREEKRREEKIREESRQDKVTVLTLTGESLHLFTFV